MHEETADLLLPSIITGRLVLFTGAGLSMAPPSNLPSASVLAQECAQQHERSGQSLPPEAHSEIEALARLFHSRAQLQSYFLTRLVNWGPFLGEPNAGHDAVADFLACGACDLAVTANVDFLVENAASRLGEPAFDSALDGDDAAIDLEHRPYLKLHGCCQKGRRDTLWCREQLSEDLWARRIASSSRWLAGRLSQRDIVFIGYWTDWAYLNEVLVACLGDGQPRSVVVVDPSSTEDLQRKAKGLWDWANRPGIVLRHERMSGDSFLDELRSRFSVMLLRQIVDKGRQAFLAAGGDANALGLTMDGGSTDDLYALRRDWTGVPSGRVSRCREATDQHELLGRQVLHLAAVGAALRGSAFEIGTKRVRVVHGAGRLMHAVRNDFSASALPVGDADVTICVGAEDDGGVPEDLLRGGGESNIVRPRYGGEWCTHLNTADLAEMN